MNLNEFFEKIIVINLAHRTDRWAHVMEQCSKHSLSVERFDGCDFGRHDGNRGCTESHGAVLRLIIENGWQKTLILEDDFDFLFDDSQERFSNMISQVPGDWFMLYLGGHYGNVRNKLVAPNVVRFGHMKTTSSYGVTLPAATEMAPFISGANPIDELYEQWHRTKHCYIFSPRLAVQYEGYSDLQNRVMENVTCMTDTSHEELLKRNAT